MTRAPGRRPWLLDFSLVAPGGSHTHAAGFLSALAAADRSDHELLVALPASPSLLREEQAGLEAAGVRTTRIGSSRPAGSWASRLAGQVSLPRLVRRERPEVVFVPREVGPLLLTGPRVLLAANVLRWQRSSGGGVSAPRPPWPQQGVALLKDRVAARAVRRAVAIIAPSRVIADLLPPELDVRVIPFGIDLPPADDKAVPLADRRPLRLVVLGALTRHKRIEGVVDLVAALAARHGVEVTLDIWGHAPQPEEETRIRAHLAAELGRAGRLRGYLDPAERHAMLASADALVMGSGIESFGFAMVEAMRTSTLVVAGDSAIAREICGDAAVLYPEGEVEVGAARLAELLDPGRAAEAAAMVGAGRRRSEAYTWDRCVEQTLQVLAGAR